MIPPRSATRSWRPSRLAESSTIPSPAAAACSSVASSTSARNLTDGCEVHVGDRIASLVSLTLTPLALERIRGIDMKTARVDVDGRAILFACAHFARLPEDIPTGVALAVLDVAGAPAQVRRLAQPGSTVVVIGADGKSGLLACAQAKARVGSTGRVIGIAPDAGSRGAQLLRSLNLVDDFIEADARNAGSLLAILARAHPWACRPRC